MRIVLVRHGRPAMARQRWIGHRAFARFMDAYRDAGLDRANAPPEQTLRLTADARQVFASDLKRSIESARRLVPKGELVSDPVFTEAPLASPPVPGIRLKAPAWAVVARVAWHGGYTPRIESYRQAKTRANKALEMLTTTAKRDGTAVLVGHGYFNAMLGRMLRLRGWSRDGAHRAEFWNTVVYEFGGTTPPKKPKRVQRIKQRLKRRPKKTSA